MKIKTTLKVISIIIVSFTILIAILVSSARILTPRLAEFDQQIVHFLHDVAQHPITLENVEAQWSGLGPVVYLNNLKIWDEEQKKEIASIGEAQIHLSILDLLLNRGIVPTSIVINNVETSLVQFQDGKVKVIGSYEQKKQKRQDIRSTLNWLLEHKEIILNNVKINLHLANGKQTSVRDISLVLTQEDKKVRAELAGTLYDTEQRGHLLLTAFLDPHYLLQEQLDGDISISLDDSDIPSWLGLWPKQLPIHIEEGYGFIGTHTLWKENKLARVQTNAALERVNLKSNDNQNAFNSEQINWHIDWQPASGLLYVESEEINFTLPRAFTHSTHIQGISTTLHWKKTPKGLVAYGKNVLSLLEDAEVFITGSTLIPEQKDKIEVELYAEAKSVPITQAIAEYLPENILSPRLIEWLNNSIPSGTVDNAQMILRGPVYEFPFEQNQGKFEVIAQIVDTKLDFSSKWPPINDLNAQIVFNGDKLIANLQSGEIAGGEISTGEVIIPELGGKGFDLLINGHLYGTAEQSVTFLQKTPIWDHLKEKLSPLNMQGPVEVDLSLELPLNYPEKRKDHILGSVTFKEAKISLPSLNLDFTQVNGRLAFDEVGVYAHNLSAQFFGEPINVNLDTKTQIGLPSYTELVLDGKLNMMNVQSYFKQSFWESFKGITPFGAVIEWREPKDPRASQIQIKSSLAGVSISLPAPFGKAAEQTQEFSYISTFGKNSQMRVDYGNILHANLFLTSGKPSSIHHGTVSIQHKAPIAMPMQGIKVIAELPELNVDLWQPIIESFTKDSSSSTTLPAIDAQITTQKINIFNKKLAVKFIGAKNQADTWNISLSGPDVKGQLIIPPKNSKQPINMQLGYLYLPKSVAETKDLSPPSPDFPNFDITINQLKLGENDYGKLNVVTVMNPNSLQFKKINITKSSYILSGTGEWRWPNKQSRTDFNGGIETKDLGLMLKDMGISQGVRGGSGKSTLDLHWNGSPFAWNLEGLQGEIDIDWRNGRLVDVKPGLGRILSLFSVRSITRRLTLDFSDVFKKGFTFDKVTANLLFDNGVMSTTTGSVTSTSGKISFDGKAFIPQEQLDLNVTVVPSVTTSLPIAAGVAVANPIAGAAVWALGSVVSPITNNLASFSYRVTGSWQDPVIEQVSSKSDKTTSTKSK